MKENRNLLNSLVGCAIALALVSTAMAQGLDAAAKVIRVKGPGRYTTGNNVWQPVRAGDVLRAGTVIQTSTEEGSYVDLVLGDVNASVPQPVTYKPYIPDSIATSSTSFRPTSEQNVVRIWANSALGIDKLTAMQTGAEMVTETQLDLKQGRITGNVKKMSAASKYEVKLPNGVAGVRGTTYDIQAIGIVKVYIGSMVVAWVDPKTQNVTTQTVMGGQAYDAPSNQLTPLSPAAMSELEILALSLVAGGTGAGAAPNSLASDHTVIGMSPVGASVDSIPNPPTGGVVSRPN
jgi:hypothetical protein